MNKKRFLIGIMLVVLLLFLFGYCITRPSGDINNYKSYYVNDDRPGSKNLVKVTFFGVSTLLFDDGETQILLDGFFSRPSALRLLFAKVVSDTIAIDSLINKYKMDRVEGIFVAHTHYDHALDVAYVTRKTGGHLYGSDSALNIGRGGLLEKDQLVIYQPYEKIQLGEFTVQVIPSLHSPDNFLRDDGCTIDHPLSQPARMRAYKEGGSYDFYLQHHGKSIYVKPSANYVEGVLDTFTADVVFLGIAKLSEQPKWWQHEFYDQTVGQLKPSVVIPLHWDNLVGPISENLVMFPKIAGNASNDLDTIIAKTLADNIEFKILQGTKSIVL